MFGIGSTELFIIAVFALLIFGPDKIPEIARTISKGVRFFKDAQEDMQKVISGELELNKGDEQEGGKKAYYAGASTAKQQEAADVTAASSAKSEKQATTASEIWSDDEDEEGDEE